MRLDQIMADLGAVGIDQFPTARAARLAAELVEEMKRFPPTGQVRADLAAEVPTSAPGPAAPRRKRADADGRCIACGWPNLPDGSCSRPGCRNND